MLALGLIMLVGRMRSPQVLFPSKSGARCVSPGIVLMLVGPARNVMEKIGHLCSVQVTTGGDWSDRRWASYDGDQLLSIFGLVSAARMPDTVHNACICSRSVLLTVVCVVFLRQGVTSPGSEGTPILMHQRTNVSLKMTAAEKAEAMPASPGSPQNAVAAKKEAQNAPPTSLTSGANMQKASQVSLEVLNGARQPPAIYQVL